MLGQKQNRAVAKVHYGLLTAGSAPSRAFLLLNDRSRLRICEHLGTINRTIESEIVRVTYMDDSIRTSKHNPIIHILVGLIRMTVGRISEPCILSHGIIRDVSVCNR